MAGRAARRCLVVLAAVCLVQAAAQGLYPPSASVALRQPAFATSSCGLGGESEEESVSELCFVTSFSLSSVTRSCEPCNTTCPYPEADGPTNPTVMPECRCLDGFTPSLTDVRVCRQNTTTVQRLNEHAHPPGLANDGDFTSTYWASETDTDAVNLTFALSDVFDIFSVTIAFKTAVPRAMVIERSTDGDAFSPYQYFAEDCQASFGMPPDDAITTPTSVICTETDVVYDPSGGTLTLLLLNGSRPTADEGNPAAVGHPLFDFIKASYIRIVFVELFRFPLDLVGPEPENTTIYWYGVEDVAVMGGCVCNGHSNLTCDLTGTDFECQCLHNTQGRHCEECLPLYNDAPWAPGNETDANACQKCQCFNHASSCEFDEMVYAESGDTSGGVCVNCTDNTTGRHCEQCLPGYYRNQSLPLSDASVCVDCDCLGRPGVANNASCEPNGQCSCKANVEGLKCDQCKAGYWNLSDANPDGCQPCTCNVGGTLDGSEVCNATTGQCPCKSQVTGRDCDQCKPQSWGLPLSFQPDDTQGCRLCDCDVGGATNDNCDILNGQCVCRPRANGNRVCGTCASGSFVPTIAGLVRYRAMDAPNATLGFIPGSGTKWYQPSPFYAILQRGGPNLQLANVRVNTSEPHYFVFNYLLNTGTPWTLDVTLTDLDTSTTVFSGTATLAVAAAGTTSATTGSLLTPALDAGHTFELTLASPNVSFTPGQNLQLNTISLVPLAVASGGLLNDTWDGNLQPTYQATCTSLGAPLAEVNLALCTEFAYSLAVEYSNGCSLCQCSSQGATSSVCAVQGGMCTCRPRVTGRRCDVCVPGNYGSAQAVSNNGCINCDCNTSGSTSVLCNDATGQCFCKANVTGRACDQCAETYYGFDQPGGCIACDCNPFGSASLQCNDTGVCTCKPGVEGDKCDQCMAGFYGFESSSSFTGCTPCNCSTSGSLDPVCDTITGQCDCKNNTQGQECDACKSGSFNNQQSNPDGCAACFCYGHASQCSSSPFGAVDNANTDFAFGVQGWTAEPIVGSVTFSILGAYAQAESPETGPTQYWHAPEAFLGNKLASYAQALSFTLVSNTTDEAAAPFLEEEGDVRLVGGQGLVVVTMLPGARPNGSLEEFSYSIPLFESGWHVTDMSGSPATAFDMQSVLVDLAALHIRAQYLTGATLNRLKDPFLMGAVANVSGPFSPFVEECACPAGYEGNSCESCAAGFKRGAVNGTSFDTCIGCQCNNHSSDCAIETGVCIDCRNNTTGDFCEDCEAGFFGDATTGSEGDCIACYCPYQFSTSVPVSAPFPGNGSVHKLLRVGDECSLTPGQGFGNATCSCPPEYAGFNCESCASNFFGSPMLGIPCHSCTCNGNFNTSLPNQCDSTTGCCGIENDLSDPGNCLYDTCGCECDTCCEGFFGNATERTCAPCECNGHSSTCDSSTGVCFNCQDHTTGDHCELCAAGFEGNATHGTCQPCGVCYDAWYDRVDAINNQTVANIDILEALAAQTGTVTDALLDQITTLEGANATAYTEFAALTDPSVYRAELDDVSNQTTAAAAALAALETAEASLSDLLANLTATVADANLTATLARAIAADAAESAASTSAGAAEVTANGTAAESDAVAALALALSANDTAAEATVRVAVALAIAELAENKTSLANDETAIADAALPATDAAVSSSLSDLQDLADDVSDLAVLADNVTVGVAEADAAANDAVAAADAAASLAEAALDQAHGLESDAVAANTQASVARNASAAQVPVWQQLVASANSVLNLVVDLLAAITGSASTLEDAVERSLVVLNETIPQDAVEAQFDAILAAIVPDSEIDAIVAENNAVIARAGELVASAEAVNARGQAAAAAATAAADAAEASLAAATASQADADAAIARADSAENVVLVAAAADNTQSQANVEQASNTTQAANETVSRVEEDLTTAPLDTDLPEAEADVAAALLDYEAAQEVLGAAGPMLAVLDSITQANQAALQSTASTVLADIAQINTSYTGLDSIAAQVTALEAVIAAQQVELDGLSEQLANTTAEAGTLEQQLAQIDPACLS